MPTQLTTAAAFTELVDLLVDGLNDGEFSQPFTAARFYSPLSALDKLGTGIRAAVFKQAVRRQQQTRGSRRREFDVQVSLVKKLQPGVPDEVTGDELILLAEEIAEYVEELRLPNLSDESRPIQTDTEIEVAYSPAHFDQLRVMLCPATFTYKLLS